ncbi:hypothetical protein [Tautonia plasticadhaerens]|uniref:Inner membrane protein YjdF n=1 Tax=Tautonia plasticadhaerens TaxID=2527974 RepID=A0A518H462_9BACT|nr:hypothetical protein [Tautonia plasticadhaerens]QDV35598.1 hypothetical protein ElP_35020 [Tautonia plasticadhaerens]
MPHEAHAEPEPARLSRTAWVVLGFTLAYMGVALVASLRGGSGEFLMYLVIMAVLLAVVALVHLRVGLHDAVLWGLSLWGLAHMAGGLMPVPEGWPLGGESPVLYNLWLVPERLKYDQLVHAYGFGLVTWICWQGMQRACGDRGVTIRPTVGLLTLCVAAGSGFGAANEVVEFAATRLLSETNVGGYVNTGWDLVANLIGCLIAAALIYGLSRRSAVGRVAR